MIRTTPVNKMMDMLFLEGAHSRDTFGNGEVELMEFRIPLVLSGREVREFQVPGEILVATIERLGETFVPLAGTKFEAHDLVDVVVVRESMEKFRKMFFMA